MRNMPKVVGNVFLLIFHNFLYGLNDPVFRGKVTFLYYFRKSQKFSSGSLDSIKATL